MATAQARRDRRGCDDGRATAFRGSVCGKIADLSGGSAHGGEPANVRTGATDAEPNGGNPRGGVIGGDRPGDTDCRRSVCEGEATPVRGTVVCRAKPVGGGDGQGFERLAGETRFSAGGAGGEGILDAAGRHRGGDPENRGGGLDGSQAGGSPGGSRGGAERAGGDLRPAGGRFCGGFGGRSGALRSDGPRPVF